MKKASITIFVIIGLIIIASLVFVMVKIPESADINAEDLSREKTNTKYYIDTCLDLTTTQAVELFGFDSENAISSYVDSNLLGCVGNFSFIKEYDVEYGNPRSNVIINDEVVFVDLNFPVEIKKNTTKVELEEFQYSLKRLTSYKLDEGVIKAGTTYFSNDKNLIVTVEQDTNAVDSRGRKIESLSFNLLDKNFDGLNNGVVISNTVYEGLPNGAHFEPALKLTIRLRKDTIPTSVSPTSPMIAWYDREGDIWRSYPSLGFDQDDTYYYYTSEVDHFTPMAIVTCGGQGLVEPIDMGYVFRSLITPIDDTYWKENDDNDGFHLIPEVMGNATCYPEYYAEEIGNIEEMSMSFNVECEDLFGDHDKDEGAYTYNEDEACLASCLELGKQYLNCYYKNEGCDSLDFETFAVDLGWSFDPFSTLYEQPYLTETSMFAKDVTLACEEECVFDLNSITPTSIESDENIRTTFEKANAVFATPRTYGYPDLESVGGSGDFIVNLPEEGNTCVDSWGIVSGTGEEGIEGLELKDMTGKCSSEDICSWSIHDPEGKEISELIGGDNILTVEVSNTNDHLAYATGYLIFEGETIGEIKTEGIEKKPGVGGGGGFSELGGGSGEYYDMAAGDFKEIFPGIELKKVDTTINPEIEIGRPLQYYVAKIDLDTEPNFFVTPRSPNYMVASQFLADYASQEDLVLAVNGGGFNMGASGGNINVIGYAMSSGDVYSSAEYKPGEATVAVSQDNEVGFNNEVEHYHALTGFQAVVMDGKTRGVHDPSSAEFNPEKGYDNLEPRTSIGIDKENNIMYIIVVDGRNPGVSEGVSLHELGEIHLYHGSTYAVNMDGGGSSTMVINQANTAMIVNTPSDGNERAVANHFGVGVKGGASSSGGLGLGGGGSGSSTTPTNFRIISDSVAVGGQPDEAGFEWLKEQGYTKIIDLATENSEEPSMVSSLGMNYVPNALGPYISENPPAEFYSRVDYAVSQMQQGNVYVHCTYGVHRTGVVVAVYGMRNLGWSAEEAVSVMQQYGGSAWDPYSYLFDVIREYPV